LYGKQNLKDTIAINDRTVECPVKNCRCVVERQRHNFRREDRFMCPDHHIYISPSTFEYSNVKENLLWQSSVDLDFLKDVIKVKRECRMARDNSEDAVTWNIFRYLETSGQLNGLLSQIIQTTCHLSELIYWSYSAKDRGVWSELKKARHAFGENPKSGSEPDLIAVTDKTLLFVEAKLTATNNTQSKHTGQQYMHGGNGWYKHVFRSDFDTVAVQAKKYELLRFWLFGSWMAKEMNRDFYLLNIVLSKRDQDIEERFLPHAITNDQRHFKRITWETLYEYIVNHAPTSQKKETLKAFFENKTTGYKAGIIQKAFSIS